MPPIEDAPVVLVTGASTGLGLALARALREKPYRLALTARQPSLSRFQQEGFVEDERTCIQALDVTSAVDREAAVNRVSERWGGVDVLINNAGISYRTVVEHFSESDFQHVMDVNFFGPMDLIRRVLPAMRTKGAGRILSVSSVGGMMAMPTMALYSASKFALEGACEALWYEVRPWNIRVTLIEPGFINSRSFENTRYTPESRSAASQQDHPYHDHYRHMTGLVARLMRTTGVTPERVAKRIVRVMEAGKPGLRVHVTPDAHVFSLLRRLLPRQFYHAVLYRGLPGIKQWGTVSARAHE